MVFEREFSANEVVSPTNSRDLSKFTDLKSAVVDAESAEVLASNDVADDINPGYE